MKRRLMSLAVLVALCGAFTLAPLAVDAKSKTSAFTKIAASGTVTNRAGQHGTFNGWVTINQFKYDQAQGLMVRGVVHGHSTINGKPRGFTRAFGWTKATLGGAETGAMQTKATCQILTLDIGAIHLDLLGLVVDLAPVHLNITAQSGPGNLLGNLLCSIAGLLNPQTGLLNLLDNLTNLLNLLNQLNGLLR